MYILAKFDTIVYINLFHNFYYNSYYSKIPNRILFEKSIGKVTKQKHNFYVMHKKNDSVYFAIINFIPRMYKTRDYTCLSQPVGNINSYFAQSIYYVTTYT